MPRRLLASLALAVLALVPVTAADARPGELLGHITGLPSEALFGEVEVLAPSGQIAAARQLRPTGGFKFGVAPGNYLLLATASNQSGGDLVTVTAPLRARSHKRTKVRGQLKALAATAPLLLEPLAHGAVVTVASIPVIDNGGGTQLGGAELREHVENLLYDLCSSQGTVLVNTSPQFVAAAEQERALSLAHKLSTPFDYKPLPPRFVVGGKVEVKRGPATPPHDISLSVELTASALNGGAIVARGSSGLPEGSTEITPATLQSSVDLATEALARGGCGAGAL